MPDDVERGENEVAESLHIGRAVVVLVLAEQVNGRPLVLGEAIEQRFGRGEQVRDVELLDEDVGGDESVIRLDDVRDEDVVRAERGSHERCFHSNGCLVFRW